LGGVNLNQLKKLISMVLKKNKININKTLVNLLTRITIWVRKENQYINLWEKMTVIMEKFNLKLN
jgi:hypothetical protein